MLRLKLAITAIAKIFFMPFRVFSFCKDSARRAQNKTNWFVFYAEPPPNFALWAE
jgi:hypothetical protein